MTRAEAREFALTLNDRYLAAATRMGIDASVVGQHVRIVLVDQIEKTARHITKHHVMTQPKQDGTATLASPTMDAYDRRLWRTAGVCNPS